MLPLAILAATADAPDSYPSLAGCGYGRAMARIGAVLIDIDGVLTVSWKPLAGAVAALQRLRAAALPLALVTNTTSRTRGWIPAGPARAGVCGTPSDTLT